MVEWVKHDFRDISRRIEFFKVWFTSHLPFICSFFWVYFMSHCIYFVEFLKNLSTWDCRFLPFIPAIYYANASQHQTETTWTLVFAKVEPRIWHQIWLKTLPYNIMLISLLTPPAHYSHSLQSFLKTLIQLFPCTCPMKTPLLLQWLFLISLLQIIPLVAPQCLRDQKKLLLQLHSSLKFDSTFSTKLVNWNGNTDCCY